MRQWAKRLAVGCLSRPENMTFALPAKAVVFAPHPDDDVLGCGGLILRKRECLADVYVVYMTDGRRSHGHLVDAQWLVRVRQQEACESARRMGVEADRLHFLGFEDGRLSLFMKEAQTRVREILRDISPAQVLIPSRLDSHPDHAACRSIVTGALAQESLSPAVLEFPVWAWNSWPFVQLTYRGRSEIPRILLDSLKHVGRLKREFRSCLAIDRVLERKRHAIEAHASQTIRLIDDPRWGTLSDVSNGEFLACFDRPFEIYCQKEIVNCES